MPYAAGKWAGHVCLCVSSDDFDSMMIQEHSYGTPLVRDGSSVKLAIGEWSIYTPAKNTMAGRDFMALNRMAIQHGTGQAF